jgi:NTE family protein
MTKSKDSRPPNTQFDTSITISEGSDVVMDAYDFVKTDFPLTKNKSYEWCQVGGPTVINLVNDKTQSVAFRAPYIEGKDVTVDLKFRLTITNKNNEPSTHTVNVIVTVKKVQRALILQGAVSLGAYEFGVYQELCKQLKEDDAKNGRKNRNLFDIIAGTSIGAMNASIILSSFMKKKNFDDSIEQLEKFWSNQMIPTFADIADRNPFYHFLWDYSHNTNKMIKQSWEDMLTEYCSNLEPNSDFTRWCVTWKDYFIDSWDIPATGEAARRHFSSRQFPILWPMGIYSIVPRYDGKFWDPSDFKYRTDNRHVPLYSLVDTLERVANFPIKTHEGEPRFILVSIDVQSGDSVAFDSYGKVVKDENNNAINGEDEIPQTECRSEYGNYDEHSKKYEHVISYPKGISIEHVIASSAFPLLFDYPSFEDDNSKSPKKKRAFWDGGYLSNTPLREVIQAHRDYWMDSKEIVPDLEVYIADTWPTSMKEDPISLDNDFIEDRKDDLIFGDKTDYDEKVANIVTDYVDLTNEIIRFATINGIAKNQIDRILEKRAKRSKSRTGKTRRYRDLLAGRFGLTKVVRIQLMDDGNTIANKYYDYSQRTISQLIEQGKYDTVKAMEVEQKKVW